MRGKKKKCDQIKEKNDDLAKDEKEQSDIKTKATDKTQKIKI